MKDKDYIEKLFSDKLSNMEVPVNADLWSTLQSSIGSNSAVASVSTVKSLSIISKIAIASVSAAAIVGSVAYFSSDKSEQSEENKTVKSEQKVVEENKIEIIKEKQESKPKDTGITVINHDTSNIPNLTLNKIDNLIYLEEKNNISNNSAVEKQQPSTHSIHNEMKANFNDNPISLNNVNESVVVNESKESISMDKNVSTEDKQGLTQIGLIEKWNDVNVFSPNNDGFNDYFFLNTKNIKEFTITILDKQGNKVYQSNDSNFKWDGRHYLSDEEVPSGDYVYMVYATDNLGNPIKLINQLKVYR